MNGITFGVLMALCAGAIILTEDINKIRQEIIDEEAKDK